jgi:predicted small lipoprotein YifL
MRTAVIMLLLAVLVQGCGRKGPLYMPAPGATPQPDQSQPKK